MGDLIDRQEWTAAVRRIEPGDSVIGGSGAPINLCLEGINNRTVFLKKKLDEAIAGIGQNKTTAENMFARKNTTVTAGAGLTGGGTLGRNFSFALGTPGTLSGSTTNWAGSNTHTHQIAAASATVAGVAKLVDNLTTDDPNAALSAAQGKKLNEDKADKTEVVLLTGNQEIAGNKKFTSAIEVNGQVKLNHSSLDEPSFIGVSANDLYISNKKSNKSMQLMNDGRLVYGGSTVITEPDLTDKVVTLTGSQSIRGQKTFEDKPVFTGGVYFAGNRLLEDDNGELKYRLQKILRESDKSDAINLNDSNRLATSKAVHDVNNRIDQVISSGVVAYFAGRVAPRGWLKANGAAVSRTTYAGLYAVIGTTYGNGDGRTTFNLPDLRGEFVRGFDDGRNIDRGRALGSNQEDAIKVHSHYYYRGHMFGQKPTWNELATREGTYDGDGRFDDSGDKAITSIEGGSETRPRNIALLACIKI